MESSSDPVKSLMHLILIFVNKYNAKIFRSTTQISKVLLACKWISVIKIPYKNDTQQINAFKIKWNNITIQILEYKVNSCCAGYKIF